MSRQLKGLELRVSYQKELKEEEARLKELNEKGIKALSKYDIEITSGGDANEALRTAKWLVSNHIYYFKKQLGEGQQTLFNL
jgi:hypothetical protein